MPAPEHSSAYRLRRFLNWFPLGVTYATYYMGRYNFNVIKGDMGARFHLDKAQMGLIATCGFWTYALSVSINGPLADKLGGRRAILFGALGTMAINLLIGLLFMNGWSARILVGMSLLYSVNMYFQSFGALSVVKVNSSWFHVRERGTFGGVFGAMISAGYFLALSVGGWIFATFSWYMVFLVPSVALAVMFAVDFFLVRDFPRDTGHEDFDTGDASSGDDAPIDFSYLVKKVFTHPVILVLAAAEFCTGFVRQGLLLYFVEYLKEVHGVAAGSAVFWWAGTGVTLGGIAGGILCGVLSDRYFDSRRPPVAFIYYLLQIVALLFVGLAPTPALAALAIALACAFIFGVHGMLSGTASMDFGGKKAAATAAGMLDGVQYLASGLTGVGLGWLLKTYGWDGRGSAHPANAIFWVATIMPFSAIGAFLMTRIWRAKPGAH